MTSGSAREMVIQPVMDKKSAWAHPTEAARNRTKPEGLCLGSFGGHSSRHCLVRHQLRLASASAALPAEVRRATSTASPAPAVPPPRAAVEQSRRESPSGGPTRVGPATRTRPRRRPPQHGRAESTVARRALRVAPLHRPPSFIRSTTACTCPSRLSLPLPRTLPARRHAAAASGHCAGTAAASRTAGTAAAGICAVIRGPRRAGDGGRKAAGSMNATGSV